MLEFTNTRAVLEEYKQRLISEYNNRLGNSKHTLQISIEEPAIGIFNVTIVGPEEVKFIEDGRGPGKQPPVDTMQEWVKNKLGETELPRVKQLAYLVGRKISLYGTEGNHLIESITRSINPEYEKKLYDALNKDWNENDSKEISTNINTMIKRLL